MLTNAYNLVSESLRYETGAFYGSCAGLSIGAGLLYANLRQPAFDAATARYKTVRGSAYVITHECDIHQGNNRPLNDSVLICPIIRFEEFVESYQGLPNLPAFLGELATRGVFRAVYIPSLPEDLPYGGVLYLNRITSTHLSVFDEAEVRCIGAVARIGLLEIDAALQNLLMREKSERLSGVGLRR